MFSHMEYVLQSLKLSEEEIDNLINDSDTEFIADEEILQANNTLKTSLTTTKANIPLVRDNKE